MAIAFMAKILFSSLGICQWKLFIWLKRQLNEWRLEIKFWKWQFKLDQEIIESDSLFGRFSAKGTHRNVEHVSGFQKLSSIDNVRKWKKRSGDSTNTLESTKLFFIPHAGYFDKTHRIHFQQLRFPPLLFLDFFSKDKIAVERKEISNLGWD